MTGIEFGPLPKDPRVVFMGTPDFAVPTLRAIIDSGFDVISVVTQPDRPKGRGRRLASSPVKKLALESSIEILQPDDVSTDEFCNILRKKAPDIMIVVAFGQILKRCVLDIPDWGALNIHASLLPKYRGAAPIQQAILNNETITGITIMGLDEGLDTGPIFLQKEAPILENETAGQLHDRLALLSGDLMIDFIDRMMKNPIKGIYQDDSKASYAPKIEKSMGKIDWTQEAVMISCQVRALDPWPGAYTKIKGKNVKLFSSCVTDESRSNLTPGKVIKCSENHLCVETGKGILLVKEILYPGKKRLLYNDFIRGFDICEGTILG